jgi:Glycosyltransferase family 87
LSYGARRLAVTAVSAGAVVGWAVCVWFGLRTLAIDLPVVVGSLPGAGPQAIDVGRHLTAASTLARGADPYGIGGFYYSPLGAALMIPLAATGEDVGTWVWFGLKIAIAAWCIADATRDRMWPVRIGAALFVFTSIFVLDDLWLGNVSIAVTAAVYIAVSRDRSWAAIPLGVVMAAVPKPFLIPFLAWMLVFRRSSAVWALATAAVMTLISIALIGSGAYGSYLEALTVATRSAAPFAGNLGLSDIAPSLFLPASVASLAVFAFLLWRSRDAASLLLWSLLVGVIAAPYVGHYSVVPVLAAVPAFARVHPTRTLLLVAVVAPISLVAIELAAAVGLVVAMPTDWLRGGRRVTAASPDTVRTA